MDAKKKPRTSYTHLSQETKDKRNQYRRELDSNVAEVARAKRNERRRLAYVKKANIYDQIRESKTAKINNSCTELRLGEENNHGKVMQSVCTPVLFENQSQEMVRSLIAGKTGHANNLEVLVEATPDGPIPTYQDNVQIPVVDVIQKVSSSFPANVRKVMRNGRRTLTSIDRANMYINIPNADRGKHNECCEQPYLEREKSYIKTTQVVCNSELYKNVCPEMVDTIVDARSAQRMNTGVEIEQIAVQSMSTDEYCMQSSVAGVLREVPRSSVDCCTTSVHEIGEFHI